MIENADAACVQGGFFFGIRRWFPDLQRHETVLTLRTQDVIGAEVLRDGVRIDYVPGLGEPSE